MLGQTVVGKQQVVDVIPRGSFHAVCWSATQSVDEGKRAIVTSLARRHY